MNPTAMHICAPNDANGNPRRGWLFTLVSGRQLFWVEDYAGVSGIRVEFLRNAAKGALRINVSAQEFRRIADTYKQEM